jgi:hypothetical protein
MILIMSRLVLIMQCFMFLTLMCYVSYGGLTVRINDFYDFIVVMFYVPF